jgi:hypothetical protein
MGTAARDTRRTNLNDRILKALKGATDGKPYDVRDTVVPGLRVRVMGSGQRTFVLLGRYPGSKQPTRRALGTYVERSKIDTTQEPTDAEVLALDVLTLAEARRKAKLWRGMIGERKIDPALEQKRQQQAEQLKRKNSFAAVAEDFFVEKLPGERKGEEVKRDIKANFVPQLGAFPITEITDLQIIAIIKAKKRTAPGQARNLLGYAKRLFTWAVAQRCYGLKASPCDGIKPSAIIGKSNRTKRLLSDDELFALWRAAERLKYPAGSVYQLLMLLSLRLNEVADASLPEFDPALVRVLRTTADDEIADQLKRLPTEKKLWIIPAERMKGRNGEAHPHAVPLSDDALDILATLPRFKKGKFLFSTTFGEKPVWISDKIKKKLDARMLRTLGALARRRGDDPKSVELPPWRNHHIRHAVRSNLSRLRIAEEAREAVLAHVRPGIKGVYDLYDYLDEKREALELWAVRLRSIVEPPQANVLAFPRAASPQQAVT